MIPPNPMFWTGEAVEGKALHLDLEKVGPSEYNVTELGHWLYNGQIDKNRACVRGGEIHKYLKRTNTLKTILGLLDLLEIQKMGITFFRKYFRCWRYLGWKGIVQDRKGRLFVPVIYDSDVVLSVNMNHVLPRDTVILDWDSCDQNCFTANSPALSFPSNMVVSPLG